MKNKESYFLFNAKEALKRSLAIKNANAFKLMMCLASNSDKNEVEISGKTLANIFCEMDIKVGQRMGWYYLKQLHESDLVLKISKGNYLLNPIVFKFDKQ